MSVGTQIRDGQYARLGMCIDHQRVDNSINAVANLLKNALSFLSIT